MIDGVVLTVRQPLTDAELNALFAAAWPDHRRVRFEPVLQRSLIWIAARSGDRLVGFVNVATDVGPMRSCWTRRFIRTGSAMGSDGDSS
jgi:hypothetical protein